MIAAPWNIVGLLTIQTYVLNRLKEETGWDLHHARLVDFTDSYHVKADDQPKLETFIEKLTESKRRREGIEKRVFPRDMVLQMINESRDKITEKIMIQAGNYFQGKELEDKITNIERIAQTVVDINNTYLGN